MTNARKLLARMYHKSNRDTILYRTRTQTFKEAEAIAKRWEKELNG